MSVSRTLGARCAWKQCYVSVWDKLGWAPASSRHAADVNTPRRASVVSCTRVVVVQPSEPPVRLLPPPSAEPRPTEQFYRVKSNEAHYRNSEGRKAAISGVSCPGGIRRGSAARTRTEHVCCIIRPSVSLLQTSMHSPKSYSAAATAAVSARSARAGTLAVALVVP